jgi:Na+-transporting methylmalonyl-CoA/oxaloacetate decarboxylase gamma subunit
MMWRIAKQELRRLAREEDGAVLALTVIVFLVLFLMAAAVYAIGEVVRERIEIQNATDAAAYSAAVVEADTLSRIAAINQAMAWTHVKLNRMQMDYIVDKWLEKVVDEWDKKDYELSWEFNYLGTANWGRPTFFWNGFGGPGGDRQVLLNKMHMEYIDTIRMTRYEAAAMQKSYNSLDWPIQRSKQIIRDMNDAEKDLIDQMDSRMEKAVNETMQANLQESKNDQAAGGAGIKWCFLRENPKDNFKIFRQGNGDDEKKFLAHADYNNGPKQTYGRGTDVWWNGQSGEGLKRSYEQQFRALVADWQWYSTMWEATPDGPVLIDMTMGTSCVKGEDVRDGNFDGELAKPRYLKKEYFVKNGALVVGAKRRLNNPFYAILANNANGGVFRAFTVPSARSMWTASAAIAGHKPAYNPGTGVYEVTYTEPSIEKLWNLKQTDWDAVMIPLHRARSLGTDGSWDSETGGQVLQKVAGELGTGQETAPKGMSSQGATFSPAGTERQLRH